MIIEYSHKDNEGHILKFIFSIFVCYFAGLYVFMYVALMESPNVE
jgi:hypothetical protein